MASPAAPSTTFFTNFYTLGNLPDSYTNSLADLQSKQIVGEGSQKGFFSKRCVALGHGLTAFTNIASEALLISVDAPIKVLRNIVQLDVRGAWNQGVESVKQLLTALKVTIAMVPLILLALATPDYAYSSIAHTLNAKRNEHDPIHDALLKFLDVEEMPANLTEALDARANSLLEIQNDSLKTTVDRYNHLMTLLVQTTLFKKNVKEEFTKIVNGRQVFQDNGNQHAFDKLLNDLKKHTK